MKRTGRYLLFTTGFLITLFTVVVITLGLTNFTARVDVELVEEYLSEQIQRPVRIESINTRWNGLLAEIEAHGVRVLRRDGVQSSLHLRRLNISIDPLTLFSEHAGLEYIVAYGLVLQVYRRLDGSIQIGDLASDRKPGPNPALEWLLGQPRTEIRQAELSWVDQSDPGRPLWLDELNMVIENDGDEIRFEGQASPPRSLGKPVRISGEIRGQPMRSGLWDGHIQLTVDQLQLDKLPLVLAKALPWDTAGLLQASIDTEWLDGHIIEADGQVRLSDFEIPFEGGQKIIPVDNFSSSISWQHNLKNWRLVFGGPGIEINGHILGSKRLVVSRTNQTRTYYVDALELEQVVDVVNQLPFDIPWHEIATQINSRGRFEAISVVTRGPFLSPDHWRAEARFDGMSWRPFSGIPGVTGATGSVVIEPEAGNVRLDGTGVTLDLPDSLQESLYFNRYRSDISWARHDDGWNINIDDLDLSNSDMQALRGRAMLRVPADGSALPYIDSQFTVAKFEVDKLTRYLPARIIPAKATAWMNKALLQGSLTDTRIDLKGDLNQFPFRTGGGSFYLSSRVLGARLHYADRWSDIDHIYGSLSFNNAAMHGEITSAEIRNSRVRDAVVESSDMFRPGNELNITASLASPVQDVVEFLIEGPLTRSKSTLPLQAAGNGELNLELFLPLANLKNGVKVAGRYAVNNAELVVADRFLFKDLNGVVDFTESTVEASAMSGSLLGGRVTFDIETLKAQRPPVWRIRAQGDLDTAELVSLSQSRVIGEQVAGMAPWTGTLTIDGGTAQLEIYSDLSGVGVTLPAPLYKAPDEKRESTLRARYERDKHLYQFESGPLKGSLEYRRSESGLMIQNGVVALGKSKPGLPPAQGIRVEIRQPFINADKWLA
ncbi:DUF3971 domain-containing protein, partial [Gammaproteobacteria bacterium]|nr:DUF3971 domain-containing protein [Gammaproteobacteria bacterium]